MSGIAKILKEMKANPKVLRFNDLQKACTHYFEKPHQSGSSHYVYKTPWPDDPRVNIQNHKRTAKPYQVRQVILAIDKIEVNHSS
jgi:hypothetical protein